MRRVLIAVLLLMIAGAVAQRASAQTGPWREQTVWVPAAGAPQGLYTRICRPPGETPARVAVIAHGSPANASARPGMTPISCDSEAARWFLQRGYVVIAAMRRGYGQTGGSWPEDYGTCSNANFAPGGLEGARDLAAVVEYAAALPFAKPQGMIVIGQSAGGFATIAYDSVAHPRVTALINMSGGRGGHHNDQPNSNCSPDKLAVAAGQYGAHASTPMLWVYTANDSFFSPQIAAAMYAAFTQAGGRAEFQALPAFGSDGHNLFSLPGGSAIWGPLVDRYLATRPAQ